MNKVILAGGAGYIGQALYQYLGWRGLDPLIVDPCYIAEPPAGWAVIREDASFLLRDQGREPVVYLASLHDFPCFERLDPVQKRQWQEVGRRLMIDVPVAIAKKRPMLYISSMRSLTHSRSFYGQLKKLAEILLFRKASTLRLGTVYGFTPGLYNRTITVPNNYLVRGELPDTHWAAHVVDLRRVIGAVASWITSGSGSNLPEVWNATQGLTNRDTLKHRVVPREDLIDERIAREPHPASLMAKAYGLPYSEEV